MNSQMMMRSWVAFNLAKASRLVLDSLHSVGFMLMRPECIVDTDLWCLKCREPIQARCRLDSWTEFDKQLRDARLNCDCGGQLVRDLPLIITP